MHYYRIEAILAYLEGTLSKPSVITLAARNSLGAELRQVVPDLTRAAIDFQVRWLIAHRRNLAFTPTRKMAAEIETRGACARRKRLAARPPRRNV